MNRADHIIRDGVATADRLRRTQEANRRLWRVAPAVAAGCAIVAAAARWIGWSPLIPLAVLALSLAALAAYAYGSRRERTISDAAAADIDGRAGLGGELRSAAWFAARDSQDPWVEFHIARAADRVQVIDWVQLYPPVRAHRAKAASALMAIGALALVMVIPGRDSVHASGWGRAAARGLRPASADSLTPDLLKQLEELLRAAEGGTATGAGRALTAGEVRDLLSRLAGSKDLRTAKDGSRADPGAQGNALSEKDLAALAERAKRASEIPSLSPEVRDALADVAEKLSDIGESAPMSPRDPRDAVGSADAPKGEAAPTNKSGNKDDSSVQAVKDASGGTGVGVIMISSQDEQSTHEAGLGLGGGSAENKGGGTMADLAAALRKETLEAHADAEGENIPTEIRRKTERATATVAYTSTAPATFDRSRATAPPAVPESRRAAVKTYFIRHP
jgi:hypothetical protein